MAGEALVVLGPDQRPVDAGRADFERVGGGDRILDIEHGRERAAERRRNPRPSSARRRCARPSPAGWAGAARHRDAHELVAHARERGLDQRLKCRLPLHAIPNAPAVSRRSAGPRNKKVGRLAHFFVCAGIAAIRSFGREYSVFQRRRKAYGIRPDRGHPRIYRPAAHSAAAAAHAHEAQIGRLAPRCQRLRPRSGSAASRPGGGASRRARARTRRKPGCGGQPLQHPGQIVAVVGRQPQLGARRQDPRQLVEEISAAISRRLWWRAFGQGSGNRTKARPIEAGGRPVSSARASPCQMRTLASACAFTCASRRDDAVHERLAADQADIGIGRGLRRQMLAAAEADLEPHRARRRRRKGRLARPAMPAPRSAAAGRQAGPAGRSAGGGRGAGRRCGSAAAARSRPSH